MSLNLIMPKDNKYKRLIKEVFKRPVLYEYECNDSILVEEAWKKVASTMRVNLTMCKKMWTHLYETFERKHGAVIIADDEDVRKQKELEAREWEYYEKLMFLESFMNFSRVELSDIKYDFPKWGEFSEVMMPDSSVLIKEEDPLGDGRILAESRRRKCTMKPKLLFSDSSDLSEEENSIVDDYVPNKILQKELNEKRKLEEELLLEERRSKVINSLLTFFASQTYTVCSKDINKDLLNLLIQSEDSNQAFLLSLLPALKRLPAEDNFLAKERISHIILEELQSG